ncbi:MAG: alpha,alpha-trehalase TreF [Cyclobacteriaceae bacterium]
MRYLTLIIALLCIVGCQEKTAEQTPVEVEKKQLYKPHTDLGILFVDVQMSGMFEDSKTFVDCNPLREPSEILKDYLKKRENSDFNLEKFVTSNFQLPETPNAGKEIDNSADLAEHLVNHWDYLSRKPDDSSTISSLLPLPHAYIVPGGRFREIYYWDSYFTMIGLAASDRWDMVEAMTDNFAHLIDEVGFIPNGNRTYYLTRSQPPFFSSIVALQVKKYGEEKGVKYLEQLEKEYNFWMDGKDELSEDNRAQNHTVLLEKGVILNRYYDQSDEPRPESYREDIELAVKAVDKSKVYRDLRSAAESGWDFSTRWFDDPAKFETIATTDLIPVDLNCLLYHLDITIAELNEFSGDIEKANTFRNLAESRRKAILDYCWDRKNKFFTDYNFVKNQYSERVTLAGMFPLYYGICDLGQALDQSNIVIDKLLKPQGLVTTTINSGQQWDAPNGWAPLQWIAIRGLEKYELYDLANEVKDRWMKVNEKVYDNTGKMMEKYNVVDKSLEAGGGEYPTQDGFGWTNGVYLGLDKGFSAY